MSLEYDLGGDRIEWRAEDQDQNRESDSAQQADDEHPSAFMNRSLQIFEADREAGFGALGILLLGIEGEDLFDARACQFEPNFGRVPGFVGIRRAGKMEIAQIRGPECGGDAARQGSVAQGCMRESRSKTVGCSPQ